ncbi:MAG: hypothetical protein EAX86_11625 [Candidatus Heimdallarchaeota archaeon]|nr:hypothetical protein [Candidatus Heimdallarchaeota archaeon]
MGLLNTRLHIKKFYSHQIKAVIGGIYMVKYSQKEVNMITDVLESTMIFQKRFGDEKVKLCPVGTEFGFN